MTLKLKSPRLGFAALGLAAAVLAAPMASAFEYSVSGFIRQEMAYKISNDENYNSRGGSRFNGETALLTGPFVAPGTTTTQIDKSVDNDWNVFATRAEVDFNFILSNNLTAFMKLRGYYQPDVFNEADVRYQGENGKEHGEDIDYFGVKNLSNGEATYLSVSDDDYMLDIPAFYFDYSKGPLWVRFGQQQIAWGEALFFRVADVANGLDLRRHFFFDFGAEEYADERLSSPGIRASYIIDSNWEIEAFAQMFQPTVLPTRNSAYNPILSGFAQSYHDSFQNVKDNINVGVRLQGTFGDLGLQFFAVSRHNPDPIFRMVPGGQTDSPFGTTVFGPSGDTFADQPFVYHGYPQGGQGDASTSPEAWFYYSGIGGIDGMAVVNSLARTYPVIQEIYENAFGLSPNAEGQYVDSVIEPGLNGISAYDLLAAFYAPGSIEASLEAHYAAEEVFGFGLNYIFYAEPDTFMDQLVVRFEMSYTPDKKFTNFDLSPDWIVEDEWVTSFVVEKYQRFSDTFPATFFIFEWMHKSESDLLGRHLSGLGGDARHQPTGGEANGGWDGFVFAFQQPLPNLTWRIDGSILWDINGGIYIQPAVRYKPSGDWTIEAFANFIDSKDNASIFSTTDWSDDFTMRITYQF